MAVFPLSVSAADAGPPAILHTQGGVWVNGSEAADSTMISPGDVLETKPGFAGNLSADGSTVLIQQQSVVKYNGDSLTLEHGSVSVTTSKSFSVHVNCLRVIPVSQVWTQYDVSHVNGNVQVDARKSDVNINRGTSLARPKPDTANSQSATVKEGDHATRDASQACGGAAPPKNAGPNIPTKWIEIGAGAGGGILLCALFCFGGSHHPSISPSGP